MYRPTPTATPDGFPTIPITSCAARSARLNLDRSPRPVINPTPSYLIRVWPAINRSLHSSINSLFNIIFAITGPIVVNWPVIFLRTQFATKHFPCEVVGNVVFGNSSSRFRLYSIVNVSYIGKLKYVRNTSFFTLIRFEYC